MYSSAFFRRQGLEGNILKVAYSTRVDAPQALFEVIYGTKGIGSQVGRLIADQDYGLFHIELIDPELWPPCDDECEHEDNIKHLHCGKKT